MAEKETYFQYGKQKIKVTSKQDVYEKIYLQAIIECYEKIDKSADREDVLTKRFALYLQQKHSFTAPLFQYEILNIDTERETLISEEETRRSDLCFHWSEFGRFTIECKLLFQQPSKNKPYLDDGLIRFIKSKYARTNQFAGMMGFIVSGDIDTILAQTIDDTKDFHPSNPQKSIKQPINSNWKHGFVSFHEKENGIDLQVFHLLLEF